MNEISKIAREQLVKTLEDFFEMFSTEYHIAVSVVSIKRFGSNFSEMVYFPREKSPYAKGINLNWQVRYFVVRDYERPRRTYDCNMIVTKGDKRLSVAEINSLLFPENQLLKEKIDEAKARLALVNKAIMYLTALQDAEKIKPTRQEWGIIEKN